MAVFQVCPLTILLLFLPLYSIEPVIQLEFEQFVEYDST